MADFCKACAEKVLGFDTKDMAGLTVPEAWAHKRAALVLCEGCGPIQVDPEGNCVTPNCLRRGQPGHGLPWAGSGTPAAEPTPIIPT